MKEKTRVLIVGDGVDKKAVDAFERVYRQKPDTLVSVLSGSRPSSVHEQKILLGGIHRSRYDCVVFCGSELYLVNSEALLVARNSGVRIVREAVANSPLSRELNRSPQLVS